MAFDYLQIDRRSVCHAYLAFVVCHSHRRMHRCLCASKGSLGLKDERCKLSMANGCMVHETSDIRCMHLFVSDPVDLYGSPVTATATSEFGVASTYQASQQSHLAYTSASVLQPMPG